MEACPGGLPGRREPSTPTLLPTTFPRPLHIPRTAVESGAGPAYQAPSLSERNKIRAESDSLRVSIVAFGSTIVLQNRETHRTEAVSFNHAALYRKHTSAGDRHHARIPIPTARFDHTEESTPKADPPRPHSHNKPAVGKDGVSAVADCSKSVSRLEPKREGEKKDG